MIIQDKTHADIERHKEKLGLTGDVYLFKEHFIESLESHKKLVPNSTATTIQEAEQERIIYEAQQELKRLEQAEQNAGNEQGD